MLLNRHVYRPEDVACTYCTKVRTCKKGGSNRTVCPWLQERLEAGVVNYAELMLSLLSPSCPISCKRISDLILSYSGSMFSKNRHLLSFNWLKSNIPLEQWDTNKNLAVAYLLSSTPTLSDYAQDCVLSNVLRRPMRPEIRRISQNEIAIIEAVYRLIGQSEYTRLDDLLDDERVDMTTTRLIAHAMLIARYGLDVLKVEE